MSQRSRIAIAALACSLSGFLVQPAVRAAPPRAAGWVITRTSAGAAPLSGRFTGNAGSSSAVAVLFALTGTGNVRRISGAFTTGRIDWGVDGTAHVYGGVAPDCQVACTDPAGTPSAYVFSSNGHATDATVYVATWDVVGASVELTAPGWRVSRWTPAMRVVTSDDAGDLGAHAAHTTVGRFSGARAPGGRYGSLGWTRLPCDTYGDGWGRLTGGRRPYALDCAGPVSALDHTARRTEWRLAGEATGIGSVVNVLVVVDFPRSS